MLSNQPPSTNTAASICSCLKWRLQAMWMILMLSSMLWATSLPPKTTILTILHHQHLLNKASRITPINKPTVRAATGWLQWMTPPRVDTQIMRRERISFSHLCFHSIANTKPFKPHQAVIARLLRLRRHVRIRIRSQSQPTTFPCSRFNLSTRREIRRRKGQGGNHVFARGEARGDFSRAHGTDGERELCSSASPAI